MYDNKRIIKKEAQTTLRPPRVDNKWMSWGFSRLENEMLTEVDYNSGWSQFIWISKILKTVITAAGKRQTSAYSDLLDLLVCSGIFPILPWTFA